MRFLARYTETIYAILRIVSGLLFACHGAQKLLGSFGGMPVPATALTTFAGIIELVGGLMIALGLLAGVAAFIASGEMAVAYFKAHAPQGFWPILNHGELAMLYCFLFLYIAAKGSGILSVDSVIRKRRV